MHQLQFRLGYHPSAPHIPRQNLKEGYSRGRGRKVMDRMVENGRGREKEMGQEREGNCLRLWYTKYATGRYRTIFRHFSSEIKKGNRGGKGEGWLGRTLRCSFSGYNSVAGQSSWWSVVIRRRHPMALLQSEKWTRWRSAHYRAASLMSSLWCCRQLRLCCLCGCAWNWTPLTRPSLPTSSAAHIHKLSFK